MKPRQDLPFAELQRIGESILLRRRRLALSQEELAHRVGISRAHLGRIERGQMNVTTLNLIAVAQALGTKAGVLLMEADV